MRETGQAIDTVASEWAIRADRGLTKAEHAALEDWLNGDSRRVGAFARAQAAWIYVDRAQVFRDADKLRESRAQRRWRVALPWVSAAAVVLGLTSMLVIWRDYSQTHLTTAFGEVRRAFLADGSLITLDTGSRALVDYEAATRIVHLETGEALFQVAKNSARPFIVRAGNVRVRAVGTAFVVRRSANDDVDVTVTEGTVDVWRETSSPEPATRLSAGSQAHATVSAIAQPAQLDARQLEGAVAWVQGIIDLNGRTLAEAAAEFNRYNRQIVVIPDPALAAQTVVGRFQATNPTAFANAAAAMSGGHVRVQDDRLIIEPRPIRKK
jgi:transmembrane sensor